MASAYSDWGQSTGICAGKIDDKNSHDDVGRIVYCAGRTIITAAQSRIILLLDFRKAYDTVARDFLFQVLESFGFTTLFINMMRKLHEPTTATFLVNGSLSRPLEITTGIWQDCPLAPLLFILAAEVLSLTITQDREIQRVEVPGTHGK